MRIRTITKQYAAAGDIVCQVDLLDGGDTILATGVSIRGGAGLAPADTRSMREHTVYAALEAVRSLESKAKAAREAVLETLHGKTP